MSRLDYDRTIELLEERGIMPESAPSIRLTVEALKRLGLGGPEHAARTIVVAGTNGKGSVCAALEAIFLARGERVGLYTSPHLIDYTERIRVAGQDISRELFCDAYVAVAEVTGNLKLTHFEMLTLMAAWVFGSGQAGPVCDRIILEVGLGGLWDATNALAHDTAVITTLSYDHQNLLGRTLAEIAANKLGIVTAGRLVVHAPFPDECRAIAASFKESLGGRWVERMAFESRVAERARVFLSVDGCEGEVALAGRRGAENAALALTVARELGVEPRGALAALARVSWPGRMEAAGRAPSGAQVYLSGDHNVQGVASLLELLPHYPRKRLHLVVGVGRDKDLDGVLAPLFALPEARVYLTETPFRGRAVSEYGDWTARAAFVAAEPRAALDAAMQAAEPDDLVLVTGSLYLVGVARGWFFSNEART